MKAVCLYIENSILSLGNVSPQRSRVLCYVASVDKNQDMKIFKLLLEQQAEKSR